MITVITQGGEGQGKTNKIDGGLYGENAMRKTRSRNTAYSRHQGTKAGKQPRATQKATSSKAWGQSSSTNSLQSSSTRPRHGSRSVVPRGSSQPAGFASGLG